MVTLAGRKVRHGDQMMGSTSIYSVTNKGMVTFSGIRQIYSNVDIKPDFLRNF